MAYGIVLTCAKFPLVFPLPAQTLVQSRSSISDGSITDGIHFEFWKHHRESLPLLKHHTDKRGHSSRLLPNFLPRLPVVRPLTILLVISHAFGQRSMERLPGSLWEKPKGESHRLDSPHPLVTLPHFRFPNKTHFYETLFWFSPPLSRRENFKA